ncbi:hypothetical protein EV363DRAFT_1453537 [Boletus edulis]|nr:hypothetical protein EV363DRAFT_1453537 [Boletus edulis]
MPGFLPRRPTCFSSPEDIQAYYRNNPRIIEYADDFIDTAGNPFSNWSGSPGPSWETAPHIDDTHWNMVFEDNSEVFTENDTASIWGSEIPSLEDVPEQDWHDADWAQDFSADFDETGWPHESFNWDNPRPFTFFWPPTLQLDANTQRSLLLWHAAMDWASRETFTND